MVDDFGGSSTRIEKLSDSNYYAWKQKIVLLLALKDLDEYIECDPPLEEEMLKIWIRHDRKARAIIGLSLSDEHLEHVRDVQTAKEMWNTIVNVFERHTLLNKLSARRRFYTVSMENGEKMLTYLNRVKQLASTLKSMGVEIDDQELAMAALNGLPPSYESLIVALDALGNEEKFFTFELVKSRLLQEEQRSLERESTDLVSKPSALVGVSGSNGGRLPRRENKYANVRCKNCGNLGHTPSHCWGKNIDGKRPPNPNPREKRDNAFVGEHKAENETSKTSITEEEFVCLKSKFSDADVTKKGSTWITDSGCTAHMTYDKSLFETYELLPDANVEMGTKATTKVVGRGDITLKIQCESSFQVRKLENVLHIPSFEYSLLSVSALDKKGMQTTFGDGKCVIQKGSMVIATGTLNGSLYFVNTKKVQKPKESAFITSLQLWHERMAHVDKRGITQMARRGIVNGLKLESHGSTPLCEGCLKGKSHKSPIPKVRTSQRALAMLDRVHSDVCGPIEIPSLGGSRYFVTFIDENSNWVTVFLMKRKAEVVGCFLEYEKYAERQTGRKIRVLRSDRGGEYLSNNLTSYFKHQGIVHELTAAYTPHQNGVAERFNRTSLNLARSMMEHMSVPKRFWAEVLSTAVYIRNRVTSRALPSNLTPHHIWKKSTPTVSHLRVFGCKCWYTLPSAKVKKLDARANSAIFVGYAEHSKAYKIIDIESGKVVVSRDVTFDESSAASCGLDSAENHFECAEQTGKGEAEEIVKLDTQCEVSADIETTVPENLNNETAKENDQSEQDMNQIQEQQNETSHIDDETMNQVDEPDSSGGQITKSGRVSKPPGTWWRAHSTIEQHNALMATASMEIPKTYKEAVTGPNAKFWKKGIDSEIASLKKYKTWKLVPRSAANGRKVLTTKWVFVEKQEVDKNGKSTPFPKGRSVVRGFEQVQGVDYGETFAPVVKYTSVRVMCADVAEDDLEFHQMDAKTAFLNGKIEEEIFVEIPEGVEIEESDIAELHLDKDDGTQELDLVCKLEKSMYGTKQAPRCWNKKINSVLSDQLGFKRSDGDPCLYVRHNDEGVMMIALYVDDLLLAAKTGCQISWMKRMLSERFEMKDLGEAKVCLGLEITRDRKAKKLYLTQVSYMDKIVKRFGMSACKPFATPIEEAKSSKDKLEIISEDDEDAVGAPYREAIGSLMYLMIGTRPDISFAVGKLARFCENPKRKHWLAVKRVLRYINGTSKMGLCYNGMKREGIFGYSDSDWAGDVSDRKSTSSYVFMMAGAAVSWCSRKQTVIATSSCEAEYVAMCMACKEAVWLKRLVSVIPLKNDFEKGLEVLADSQSAIKLAANESINRRNKHIDITYHFVRDVTSSGEVSLGYVPTSDMAADMLNKPLARLKFERFRRMCGVSSKNVTKGYEQGGVLNN